MCRCWRERGELAEIVLGLMGEKGRVWSLQQ